MRPLLIVAQCPGLQPGRPLQGPSGERLASLMEIPFKSLMDRKIFRIENVIRQHVDRLTPVIRDLARESADRLLESRREGESVLLVGRWVASCFCELDDLDADELWVQKGSLQVGFKQVRIVTIPHTSGRCRFWNDPYNVLRAKRLLRHELHHHIRRAQS